MNKHLFTPDGVTRTNGLSKNSTHLVPETLSLIGLLKEHGQFRSDYTHREKDFLSSAVCEVITASLTSQQQAGHVCPQDSIPQH